MTINYPQIPFKKIKNYLLNLFELYVKIDQFSLKLRNIRIFLDFNRFLIISWIMNKKEYKKYKESIWYKIERFFDRHNHLMEFIRTVLAFIVLSLQIFIITRL